MLLSSVALVAKPKTEKNKDTILKKANRKQEIVDNIDEASVKCEKCMKESAEENSVFTFPVRSSDSSTSRSRLPVHAGEDCLSFVEYPGDRVTIATGDGLCLSVEQFYYTIVLMEESESDITCIFRKKVLETKTVANGHVETVVFALDCDQDFYLTTSKQKTLELNYRVSVPNVDTPDERIFHVFCTDMGHVFIEPTLHQHTYLHHLDQTLGVQHLDLNWRCPEEYYFHFNAVPETIRRKNSDKKKICTHVTECSNISATDVFENIVASVHCDKTIIDCSNDSTTDFSQIYIKSGMEEINDRFAIAMPTRKQTKRKGTFTNLLLGCFSGRSHSINVADS